MENPDHEIRQVVRSLCQGTADEQRRTLDRYFTRDASFVHPFCAVPHFDGVRVPLLGGRLSSRDVVRGIFQWYRMLSPRIDIEIDSVLHDEARDKIYLDIRQTFSVWFIPMYHAHVRLVTILDLVRDETPTRSSRGNDDNDYEKEKDTPSGPRQWKIAKQEDLYQVNEFLRFAGPTPLPFLWLLFQLGAAAVCVLMALFLRISPWALQREPARAGVEAVIEYRDDEGESARRDALQGGEGRKLRKNGGGEELKKS